MTNRPWSLLRTLAVAAARLLPAAALGLVLLIGLAPAAQADVPPYRIDCGPVTCSTYISRPATAAVARSLARYANASNATIATAAGGACAATGVGGVAAVACAGIGGIYGGYAVDQFVAASQQKACIRMRYPNVHGTAQPVGLPPTLDIQKVLPTLGWVVAPDSSGFCAG